MICGTALRTALVLAAALAATAARPPITGVGELHIEAVPTFCHNLDCPKYKVLKTTDDYEVRRYEASTWASTDVEAYAYALAANTGFRRLYQYIDGANKDAVKIPMTAPVRTEISAAAGPFCKNNFTISFMVPFALQHKPPAPNNPDIYISHTPAFTAFVAQKGGFVMDDYSIQRMVKGLTDALKEAGEEYDTDTFFFAGYDPPFRLTGRHNEVWVVAEEEPEPVGLVQS